MLPLFVKDTTDLLKRLDGVTVDKNALLTRIDVEALYFSIPHMQGLQAV